MTENRNIIFLPIDDNEGSHSYAKNEYWCREFVEVAHSIRVSEDKFDLEEELFDLKARLRVAEAILDDLAHFPELSSYPIAGDAEAYFIKYPKGLK